MRLTLVIACLSAHLVISPVRADLCGDCNLDGTVTVNELVQAVNNALGRVAITSTPVTTAVPTKTPLPDRCGTAQPGQRFTVQGQEFVVIEVRVDLAGSSEWFSLRYPVPIDAKGEPTYVAVRSTLARRVCPDYDGCIDPLAHGSVCGFPAQTGLSVYGPVSSYSAPAGTPQITHVLNANAVAVVTLDPAYEPLYLTMTIPTYISSNSVPSSKSKGYRFMPPDFPAPPFNVNAIRQDAASLLQYVSIRRP